MSSEIKRKEIKVGDNDDEKQVVYHDFWKEASEDLLLEIFIRSRDCQSAVRCSSVCRLWHSLIIDNPQFIPRFRSQRLQHQDRYPPEYSCTIIFRRDDKEVSTRFPGDRFYQLFSKEWMFFHGTSPSMSSFLDFLPFRMVIRASCNNLLLVSPSSGWPNGLYICNPISKQFVELPDIPIPFNQCPYKGVRVGYGLVCMPPCPITANIEFKVVQFVSPYPTKPFIVTVFCSETRKWERKIFPRTPCKIGILYNSISVVTCNGILYLFREEYGSEMVYLDLLKEHCGVIYFPPFCHCLNRIGAVCVTGGEELRLIQVITNPMKGCANLNVWRLDYNNDGDTNWVSIYNKELNGPENLSLRQPHLCQPFLHPTNSDLVFLFWDQTCFQYNLVTATYKKIEEITWEDNYTEFLVPFPMVFSLGASYLADSYC